MGRSEDARHWLRNNGYDDIADQIEKLMARWAKDGSATRRDWWQILAGANNGSPRSVDGIEFPVLRAAQVRQGLPVTSNAISRNKHETVPEVWTTGRWPERAGKKKKGR
jgi:hypothetical protein